MSGPKGGSYQVETAQQREARLLRDANARYARARTLWRAAQSRMDVTASVVGKGVHYQAPADVRDGDDWVEVERLAARWEAAAEAAVGVAAAAREAHADAIFAAQVARIAAATPSPTTQPEPEQRWQRAQTETAPPTAPLLDRSRIAERVARRLKELAPLDHDSVRVQLLVDDIAATESNSRIELLISELDVVLRDGRTAADRAHTIVQARARLEELAARVVGIDLDPVDSVRRRIADLIAAQTTDVPPSLVADVDQLVAAADAEDDREYLVASLRHALEELGYGLGAEFDTQLEGERGAAIVAGPTAGYGIKVRLESGSNRFSAQAVKSDAVITSIEQDTAAERQFCSDFEEMVDLVQQRGVELEVDIAHRAGAFAVQEVPAEHVATKASSRPGAARRPSEQERRHS